ncbi:MAG: hypothetical protein IPP32_03135 [Bacteroidetes bacterium]|nr:hypothetical protein [Bacteroidota bacterium]
MRRYKYEFGTTNNSFLTRKNLKKKIEVLIEKYAFAVENQIHNYHSGEDKDYGDEQKTMQNDMENVKMSLLKLL